MKFKPIRLGRFVDPGLPVLEIASRQVSSCNEADTLEQALEAMKEFSGVPVLDRRKQLKGILTSTDILDYLGAGDKHAYFRKQPKPMKAKLGGLAGTGVFALKKRSRIGEVLQEMKSRESAVYPVIEKGRMLGLVSERDFLEKIRPDRTGMKVKHVMLRKPLVVQDHYPIADVAKMMVKTGSVMFPVVRMGILVGVITASDIIAYLKGKGKIHRLNEAREPVALAMETKLVTAHPEHDLALAIKAMQENGVGGLPVVDEGKRLLGLVTERDVLELMV
jgi:CBS domain-containing protein